MSAGEAVKCSQTVSSRPTGSMWQCRTRTLSGKASTPAIRWKVASGEQPQ